MDNGIIVKVQLSTSNTLEKRRVFFYDKTRTLEYEGEADDDFITLMNGRLKVYFLTFFDEETGNIDFRSEVEAQDW